MVMTKNHLATSQLVGYGYSYFIVYQKVEYDITFITLFLLFMKLNLFIKLKFVPNYEYSY